MKQAGRADFGLAGLAVMGQNLVLNIESRGFCVAVFNRTAERTREFFENRCAGRSIIATWSLREFARSIRRPRSIMLMVKAGRPVDEMIGRLLPHLDRGDLLIDGGNSLFRDTERREAELKKKGLLFIGTGVSGGEYGALHGPAIMPGGEKKAYARVKDVFRKAAAVSDEGACCTLVGRGGAGHFVKMVHNGIEYSIMQEIAEVFDIMQTGMGMPVPAIQPVFDRWNGAKLNGYLVEITATTLKKVDELTGRPLVELILDTAEQKGTGRWTSQSALDLGIAVPTITASVDARIISGHRKTRLVTARRLGGRTGRVRPSPGLIAKLENALYAAELISYAQGMHLIARASAEYKYGVNMGEVARIWKGGCIIRSLILNVLRKAYPWGEHLFQSPSFARTLRANARDLRQVVALAEGLRIPAPCLSSALAYMDSFSRKRLPANLTQAQRDYFGAHTFERTDRPGYFHATWD